jgi:hypothetical protein
MSKLHVHHIQATLERVYSRRIDMKDYARRPVEDKKNALLSRSLAAYVLADEARIDPKTAAASVTDGGDDGGIDAIYWDREEHLIYLVQSKWISSGHGSPEQGDIQKFMKGIHNLLDLKFDRFNTKIQKRRTEIKKAVADPGKVILILAYMGEEALSSHVENDLGDFLKELNYPTPLVELKVYSQKELHNLVIDQAEGEPIDIDDILLYNWNVINDPILAYYGQASAEAIASWWNKHGTHLFENNLRKFIGSSTEVNEAIGKTLKENPIKFWYYNNGITILCKQVDKALMGGNDKSIGSFNCRGISIINGAQTVGCIGETFSTHADQVRQARVFVRLIDLKDASPEFTKEIARATNTQNKIGPRDFVSLDPEQQRLKMELLLEGIEYIYKTGDSPPDPMKGCTINEATVALACASSDLRLAVDAKREISTMWENIEAAPYKQLFNSGLTSKRLWRTVLIHRIVESKLEEENESRDGRDSMIAVFGNLFILHQVFKALPVDMFEDPDLSFKSIEGKAVCETARILNNLIIAVNKAFPNSFLQPLFKNKTKCIQLDSELTSMNRS